LIPSAMFRLWRPWLRHAQLPRPRHVWSRDQKALTCAAASSATLSFLAAQTRNWSLCETLGAPKDLQLSKDDEELLLSVLEGGVENLRQWTQAPTSWWDDCRSIRISGLKDVSHHIKKLDGFPIKLQMVTAVWENVSLNDLFLLSEASETCLKLSFDPVIDTMTTRLQFGNGKARFLRTMTRPTLMGLISAREVDSVLREPEIMPDGLVVGGGLGLQSPLFVDKIQQSDYLKAVASQPPSKGKVRAVDHTSGYIFKPLDDAARSGPTVRGTWKVHYILLSEAGGGVPHWAAEKGVIKAIIDWYTAAHREWVRRETTKSAC